jgi:reactive intermediate/imine deaminase
MSDDGNKRAIHADGAPAAVGPYSQAVRIGETLYCSGQIALHPVSGNLVTSSFAAQVDRVFDNLRAVVEAAGLDFGDVVKVTVFMTDLSRFSELNEIYARQFSEPFPARATVGVASLPKGAEVEIELVAVRRR